MSFRRFAFTSFDDVPPEWSDNIMSYYIVGEEYCPDTGRRHWQGYVELNNKTRFETLKKFYPTIHIEVAKGNGAQNRTYCSKGGKFVEHGSLKKPGERNDLRDLVNEISEGARVDEVAMEHPTQFLKYHKGVRELVSIHQKEAAKKERDVHVYVYWGASGVGKTRRAIDEAGNDYYISTAGNGWYDGYAGESVLIIDEMAPNAIPFRTLLRLLDRYPVQVPFKGGMTWAQWTRVYITSNHNPLNWYPGEGTQPLWRRIMISQEMTGIRRKAPQAEPGDPPSAGHVPDVPEEKTPIHLSNEVLKPSPPENVPEVVGNTIPRPRKGLREISKEQRAKNEEELYHYHREQMFAQRENY